MPTTLYQELLRRAQAQPNLPADVNQFGLTVLEGKDRVKRNPTRPYDQFVVLKSLQWAGTPHCWQRNAQGVYELA